MAAESESVHRASVAAAAYEDDLASDGYVINLTRAWAWRPDVLAAFQDLRDELIAASSLTPREVAVMVAETAAARGDSYARLRGESSSRNSATRRPLPRC